MDLLGNYRGGDGPLGHFKGIIMLDAGHGSDTPGKRSPVWSDGKQLLEWGFNRTVCMKLKYLLDMAGATVYFTHLPTLDNSLGERVRRANSLYTRFPDSFLISIHANAGGGTGWECYTSPGKTRSDDIASFLCYNAQEKWGKDWRMRFDLSDGDHDKEARFYMLTNTQCPAVLTENFFMDTERDCRYIMSPQGESDVAAMHFDAIVDYITDTYKVK